MQRFTGKRVLVTSGDVYMGPAIVKRFTDAGAAAQHHWPFWRGTSRPDVVICDIRSSSPEKTGEERR